VVLRLLPLVGASRLARASGTVAQRPKLVERTDTVNSQLADLPAWFLVVAVVVGLIQVTLTVVALVDLYRRPVDRVTLGNKWVWVAIILLVNLFGAIIYLAAGRKPAPTAEVPAPSPPSASRSESIADALYGPRDEGTGPQGSGPR
jgi:hypothetical protein